MAPDKKWNSPYVTCKASEWPDKNSKKHWIGPYDTSRNDYAKKAREAEWKEDEGICNNRKLAESLYEVGDFAGARYALAQIADRYIIEYQHTSRWPLDEDYDTAWNKQDMLKHIAEASIGCILNAYLAQYPDLCAAIKVDIETGWSIHEPHPVLKAVVDHEDNLTSSHALYTLRVMLDFASDIAYGKDHSWMRSVYKKACKAMVQITDLDRSESIRLRQGLALEIAESEKNAYWAGVNAEFRISGVSLSGEQQKAHRTKSAQIWKDEVEELYVRIIADQQSLLGTMAEATISSELELVNHYKSVGDTEKAKTKVRELHLLTKDKLGEDHDSTLRCMASLSAVLLYMGSTEEAGLVVHDYLSKHPRILTGSTETPKMQLREKFTTNRGWKEMAVLREGLEKLMSPVNFIWADYRLYTLRIGTVTFAPCYPADTEKDSVWTLADQEPKHRGSGIEDCSNDENSMIMRESLTQQPRASSPSRPDAGKYAFSASERDHKFLDLQVQYIPYQHFMTTSAFEAGMPYLEYTKAAKECSIGSDIDEDATTDTPLQLSEYFKKRERNDRNPDTGDDDAEETQKQVRKRYSSTFKVAGSKEYVVVKFDEEPTTTPIQGFFNNIPSEAFVSPELHVDLVSTQWADYQHFALHKLPDNATEIEIGEGLYLPCHGYISGTWTDFNVCYQRKVHEVFVVDASFHSPGINGGPSMFALRPETMQGSRDHEVTNVEKRAFCARLNPSFYCYKLLDMPKPLGVYKRKMAEGTVSTNMDEITLWDEMNAREKWDRDFETRKPTNDADRAILAQDLEAEDKRRNAWNAKREKKSEGEKEVSSDLSMGVSGSAR
ncbi:MAG: hypothetical protein Q9195_006590 [Heterodermia aff. obscurata]